MIQVIDYDTEERIELTEEEFEKQKLYLLTEWQKAEEEKKLLEKSSRDFKLRFVTLTSNPGKTKGSEYVPLPNNWRCKITKDLNFGWVKTFEEEKTDIDAITTALSTIAAMTEDGHEVARNLIRWEPKLSISVYNELSTEQKNVIDRVIVTKPATPKIELIAPKG